MTPQEEVWLECAAAAHGWWLSIRPLNYSNSDHLENPTVNCTTGPQKQLALAVARYVRGTDNGS